MTYQRVFCQDREMCIQKLATKEKPFRIIGRNKQQLKMLINDLIFNQFLLRSYTLEEKTRVWNIADSKLWYITPEQAQGFLNLESDESYKTSIIDKEVELIRKYLPKFKSKLAQQNYNLIDLGCGDGKKATILHNDFSSFLSLRYCPIDISSYMVMKATQTIISSLQSGKILNSQWNISDFENLINVIPLFRGDGFGNHFMILLGNTMSNFEPSDILYGIRNSMKKGDFLLIGNAIQREQNPFQWVKSYKNTKINDWLIKVLLQVGLSQDELIYDVRFVRNKIEEIYILQKDVKIEHLGKVLEFQKGDVIVVATSYKYTKSQLQDNISNFFPSLEIFTDESETFALALCQV
jgi:uncharacterized SAM-dependent methyltransferase